MGDFVLLYPVYALLFADTGLSTPEISSLFAIWSVTSFLLEIPSGALADAISRRVLLAAAPLLTAVGHALWTFAPSYSSFAVGFALWGAHGALQSGALEALVHEELDRDGAASRYPTLMGRASALGTAASATATGLAAPVMVAGSFTAVGTASVCAALAAAAVGATFPEHHGVRGAARASGDVAGAFSAMLRNGITVAWSRPAIRAAVLLVAAVTAIWGSLDEYLPLLAIGAGARTEAVPLLALLVYAGMAIGGLAAGPVSRLCPPGMAVLLLIAAGALALGALTRTPAGFVLIAVAFGAFQALTVAADARLQAEIDGEARSTITSVAGFATDVLVVVVFAAYAAGSAIADHALLFGCFAAWYIIVAMWLARARHIGCDHTARART